MDVARGLAILGMFVAHIGSDADAPLPNGSSWFEAFDGRSAATFSLLAGVSAGFLSGGPQPFVGVAMRGARIRILVRAAVLLPLGVMLSLLGTPIAVILPGYAVMFAMLTVALGWRPRTLLVVAGVVLLVAPPIVFAVRGTGAGAGGPAFGYVLDLLTGRFYPALVWIAYLLVGLALARLDLARPGMPRALLARGVPAAVLGYGAGALAARFARPEGIWRSLLSTEPHADSALEVTGNIGVVLCVLALCLVAARAPRVVYPVAATGALALTTYTAHIIVIVIIGRDVFVEPSNARLMAFVVVTLAATSLWRATLGRGPLEWLLYASSTAAATAGVAAPPAAQTIHGPDPGQASRGPTRESAPPRA